MVEKLAETIVKNHALGQMYGTSRQTLYLPSPVGDKLLLRASPSSASALVAELSKHGFQADVQLTSGKRGYPKVPLVRQGNVSIVVRRASAPDSLWSRFVLSLSHNILTRERAKIVARLKELRGE
ncbi:TPA: hypothetical protein HA244_06705 [Candidatus Micrarchaeota archaeon]|nr:hypothetical protein [Candidatus Micrarchaeota archaeon]